jgi:hypothetical protein
MHRPSSAFKRKFRIFTGDAGAHGETATKMTPCCLWNNREENVKQVD